LQKRFQNTINYWKLMDREFEEDLYFFCVIYENLNPEVVGTRRLILENNTILNFDDDRPGYTFFEYYRDHYQNSFLEKLKIPHLIYTGLGSIKQFETLIYDSETVEKLNSTGLEIYLYETLVLDTGPKKKFYMTDNKTYPGNYINYQIQSESYYSFELESINEFVVKNNLKNVTVFTCENNTSKRFDQYNFRVKSKEIFLIGLLKESQCRNNGYEIDPTISKEFCSTFINHKFWAGSWRYDVHRHVISCFLVNKSSKISWAYTTSLEQAKEKFWFDIQDWKYSEPAIFDKLITGDQYLINNAPVCLDIPMRATEVDVNQLWTTPLSHESFYPNSNPLPYDDYLSCFCAVITESNYAHPFATFTEKTINAIKLGRPFILVSSPGTLTYLKKHGFKTFDEFWDESYDLEENHEQRLIKILKLIDYIDGFSIEETRSIYDKMLPILEYNFNLLLGIKQPSLR
jgi:hypothetical protein